MHWTRFWSGTRHRGFKNIPVLCTIFFFGKSIPDLIPIFSIKHTKTLNLVPESWKLVTLLIPICGKSIPFPMARLRIQNICSAPHVGFRRCIFQLLQNCRLYGTNALWRTQLSRKTEVELNCIFTTNCWLVFLTIVIDSVIEILSSHWIMQYSNVIQLIHPGWRASTWPKYGLNL